MYGSFFGALKWRSKVQPMISTGVVKRLLKWIEYILVAGLVGGVLFLAAQFVQSRTVTISGKVISANTKMPISDVMVAVESGMPDEETGFGSYVKTDGGGKFAAKAKGKVSISVWKPGYAMHGTYAGYAFTLLDREIIIEIRELTPTNWITEHDAFYKLKPSHGFSFSLGQVVNGSNPDVDILVVQNADDLSTAIIEAQGEGRIIFQPFDDKVDFYNSPEAPSTGYQKQTPINLSQPGLYFVRTRDGKHYAKFRLLVDLVHPPSGPSYLDLETARLLWAYQPDGTRNLEVKPGKDLPFPLGKFGIKRESLEP